MAANGNLIFQDTNKATFVGANSNVVIDTVHASFGVGVDVNGPTSNLHVVGNCFVSTDFTASTLSGNGSGLTDLNAANVTTGTLAVTRGGTGTTISTGTGSVVLSDAPTFTGDVTFDTNTLFVDSVNNRVGVGTNSPDRNFHVLGTSRFDGEVEWYKVGERTSHANYGSNRDWYIRSGSTAGKVIIQDGGGNVGIGTTNPLNILHLSSGNTSLDASGSATFGEYSLIIHNTRGSGSGGTELGLCFNHYDTSYPSSARTPGAAITHERTDSWSKGKLHFKTKSGNTESGTCDTRMTIDASGDVGIGTTSPSAKLEVHNSGTAASIGDLVADFTGSWIRIGDARSSRTFSGGSGIKFHDTGVNHYSVGQLDGKFKISVSSGDGNSLFPSGYTEGITLNTSGNVGIGTTSPNWPLEVSGGNNSITHYGPNTTWGGRLAVGAADDKTAANDAATAQCISTNGNLHLDAADTRSLYLNHYRGTTVYYQSSVIHGSDDRLKTDEELITNATDTLLKLSPQKYKKAYTLREDESREPFIESGLMAQDVWYDAPELRHLVHLGADANPTDTKPVAPVDGDIQQDPDYSSWGTETAALNYDGLIAYLIKSNQELHARIQALENAS